MATSTITIGLDLGDRRHAVCVLDAAGEIIAEELIVNTRECLEAFSQRFPGAVIAMETGTHSPWISRLFQARSHRVIVANARKLRAICSSLRPLCGHPCSSPSAALRAKPAAWPSPRCRAASQSHTKSDVEDARLLARLCRADPKLLSPVKHRSEACQRALLSLKVRDTLVRSRVDQTNSLRFLVKSLGLRVPTGIKAAAFTRKARAALDAETCALVEPLLVAIDALSAQIKALDARLEQVATETYPDTAKVQQIPGVGPLTALCFVLTLESPERFPHARDVGPYLGLVPRRDQSGTSDKPLGITKAGNTQLRCLLVNCAHYILGPFGPPSDLREAGLQIAASGGKAAKKRAVIAVARKLAVTMMVLWRSNAAYQPTILRAA